MKHFIFILVAFFITSFGKASFAIQDFQILAGAQLSDGKITKIITYTDSDQILVKFENAQSVTTSCAINNGFFAIDAATTSASRVERLYALAITIKAQNATVDIAYDDAACVGSYPKLIWISY